MMETLGAVGLLVQLVERWPSAALLGCSARKEGLIRSARLLSVTGMIRDLF